MTNLNPTITKFLEYHNSGSIRARDEVFLELHQHYCRKSITFFRPLSDEDKEELSQEIALALFKRLTMPFKHDNMAATLYNYVRGEVMTWAFKLQEQQRYNITFPPDSFDDSKNLKGSCLKPVIRNYKNKHGDLIPAVKVIKMYKSGLLVCEIAEHFKCGPDIISKILRLADINILKGKGRKRK